MIELKQGRWVKVHAPGQANHDEKENVMDITVGDNRFQAEVTFTVRSYRKTAYWLLKYLECAQAVQIHAQVAEQIQTAFEQANREAPEVVVNGEGWKCETEKMSQGVFKTRLVWTKDGPAARSGGRRRATRAVA
jgi:hypothetical protein